MTRRGQITLATSLLLFASVPIFAGTKPCPASETNVSDPKFKPGQVWSYQTRPNEPNSTFTVLQVDRTDKLGLVISIRVDGLQLQNMRGERMPAIEHMPFSRDAMLLSAHTLIRVEKALPTMEGYEEWRAQCGGVYTISIAEAVTVAEKTFAHGSTNSR